MGGREIVVDDLTFRSLKVDAAVGLRRTINCAWTRAGRRRGGGEARKPRRGGEGRFRVFGISRRRVVARFEPGGWLPAEATLRANDWNIPGERLKLGEAYARVRGSGTIEWRAERLHRRHDRHG